MKSLIALSATFLSLQSFGSGFKSSISFSQSERNQHRNGIKTILHTSANCLKSTYAQHNSDLDNFKISRFYGDQSKFAKKSYAKRLKYLKRNRRIKSQATQFREAMIPVSCVGYTLYCLEKGFVAAGQKSIWNKVKAYTKKNSQDGTALQNALQKLGWSLNYWNADPSRNSSWDRKEKGKDRWLKGTYKGYHSYRHATVMNKNTYNFNRVDDKSKLVGFGEQPPTRLNSIPFAVAIAHTGYHVFPITNGIVYESHGTSGPKERRTIEKGYFNPLKKGKNYAPKGRYRSGIIATPPLFNL